MQPSPKPSDLPISISIDTPFTPEVQFPHMHTLAIRYFILGALVWVLFSLLWTSAHKLFPDGDAAFYTSMTYHLFDKQNTPEVSVIHGRRILGPFLAALVLKLKGVDTSSPLTFKYDIRDFPDSQWSPHQHETYAQIHQAWQIVNFLAWLLLIGALLKLVPHELSPTMHALIIANILLTPSLALLNIFWPQMNDLLMLAVFAWSLVFLKNELSLIGLATLGIAALGREQVLLLLPLVYWIFRFPLWQTLIAVLPYAVVYFFPVFPNVITIRDGISNQHLPSSSTLQSYFGLLKYHWNSLWSEKGLIVPYSIAINVGAVLLLAWKAKLLWRPPFLALVLLCFIFTADRHMVPFAILGLAVLHLRQIPQLDELRRPLSLLLALKILLLFIAQGGYWLQTEMWHLFFWPTKYFRYTMQAVWALTLIIMVGYWLYRKKSTPKESGAK